MLETKLEVVSNRLLDIECEAGMLQDTLKTRGRVGHDGAVLVCRLDQLQAIHKALHAQGNVVVQAIRARGSAS